MGTRPLNKGTNRPITLCTVKLFIQLMYNKNDHLAKWSIILRKTIEGYLESVPSLTFNTIKTKPIMHAFHSSRFLQSKWMIDFSHTSMVYV